MAANKFKSGFLSILFGVDKKETACTWNVQEGPGRIRGLLTADKQAGMVEIQSGEVSKTYISCPEDSETSLNVALPCLTLIVKNIGGRFLLEVTIVDDKHVRRRFRASNFQEKTRVKPLLCTMPLRLDSGWNKIQFQLAEFTKTAFGTGYLNTARIKVHANCVLRRVFFSADWYSDNELPVNYRL